MVNIYIDNICLVASAKNLLDWIKKILKNKFNIKNLRKIKTIIG